MAQLAQRLGFDLADALARDLEVLTHLFERVVGLLADAEAHAQDLLLARRQRREHLPRLLGQVHRDDGVGGRQDALVLDEVTEARVVFLADGRVQRHRLLRELEDLPDLVERQLHLGADLVGRRLAPELLDQVAARADELVHRLDHVHRNADRPRLVGDRARDGLTDPPGRVRRELVPALVVELVDRPHEADVALLDEVEELQAAVRVLLSDRHDEPQVGLDELGLGLLGHVLALLDLAHRLAQHALGQLGLVLDLPLLLLRRRDDPRHLVDLARTQAQLLGDGPLPQGRRADLTQRLPELLQRQARLDLAIADLAVGLVDALHELLELENDLVDLLLLEPHLLEGVQDGVLGVVDLLSVLLLRGVRGRRLELLEDPGPCFPEVTNLVDDLADALDVPLLVELGVLLVDVLDDLLDADLLLAQPVADVEDLLDRDRGVQHHLQDAPLALLDALRDLDLALAREERHRAHLAQVRAHRIAGRGVGVRVVFFGGLGLFLDLFGLVAGSLARHFTRRFTGRFVGRFVLAGVLARTLGLRRRIDDLDALGRERREPVVHLLGRSAAPAHGLVDLVVGQEALGLAPRDELALLALALLLGGRALLHTVEAFGALVRGRALLGGPVTRGGLALFGFVAVGFVVEVVVHSCHFFF